MLILGSTSDKINLVTSSSANCDVQASFADFNSGVVTLGRKNTAIASATTTDVTGSPAASTQRNIKHLSVRNKHASTSQTITLRHTDGTTSVDVFNCVLLAGHQLFYDGEIGFRVYDSRGVQLLNFPRLGVGVSPAEFALHVVGADPFTLPTGGVITTSGPYTIHTFTTNGTFVIPSGLMLNVEVLMVGGGGGGGGSTGGGGGGGGVVSDATSLSPNSYGVSVGAGGNGGAAAVGTNGASSSFVGVPGIAIGGGAGNIAGANGLAGGSGGGGGFGGGLGGAGTSSQGNAGGNGSPTGPPNYGAGGGGGAGAAGAAGTTTTGGNGGAGIASSISGSSVTYGGGGGGGTFSGGTQGSGGSGGGGAATVNGTANTGGGGGGQSNNFVTAAGNGGSGIVIIRYKTPPRPQLHIGYDASNYFEITVESDGVAKLNAVTGSSNDMYLLCNSILIAKVIGSGGLEVPKWLKATPKTFADLPAAAVAGNGARSFITDSSTTTFGASVSGGGSGNVPIYSDGSNWRVG